MGHLGSMGNMERQKVRSLRQEQLERRSTPFSAPMNVPMPDPEPPQPEIPPVDGGQTPVARTPSPPCYKVNVRILRHM